MTEKSSRRFVRTRSPQHRVVYANQTNMITSNVDVRLRFGIVESAGPDEIRVEDQVDVMLGIGEAAGVAQLIIRNLKKRGFEIDGLVLDEVDESIEKSDNAKKTE